jgi:hypothetical protein
MKNRRPITDPDEIRRRVAAHGRWWHSIELAPGIVTPGDDSNRQKLPVLEEAQFSVESSKVLPGGGFVRATAVHDDLAAKYRKLDGRIQDTPFDPSVHYYLDEEGSVHDLTGRRYDNRARCQEIMQASPLVVVDAED